MKKLVLTAILVFVSSFLYDFAGAQSGREILDEANKIQNDNPAVKLSLTSDNQSYKPGDEIKFKLDTDSEGHLTILDIGTSGEVTILFPNQWHPTSKVDKGQINLPPENANFRFVVKGPAGPEKVKAILSQEPIIGQFADNPQKGWQITGPFMKFQNPLQSFKNIAVETQSMPKANWVVTEFNFTINE
jgi:hypothetical protein